MEDVLSVLRGMQLVSTGFRTLTLTSDHNHNCPFPLLTLARATAVHHGCDAGEATMINEVRDGHDTAAACVIPSVSVCVFNGTMSNALLWAQSQSVHANQ